MNKNFKNIIVCIITKELNIVLKLYEIYAILILLSKSYWIMNYLRKVYLKEFKIN